jgi:ubiquinone/menaquinone biosynthesis C-methylase UbiE
MASETYKAKTHYQQVKIAEDYEEERFSRWYGRMAHRMESEALAGVIRRHFRAGGSILDLPCGTGRLLDTYGSGGFTVTGADISDEMLKIARTRFSGSSNYSFIKCDAERLQLEDESFDYLVSLRLMCHLPKDVRQRVLAEMARVTKRILIVNYHFDVNSPLMLFNKLLNRQAAFLPYPLLESHMRGETAFCRNIEILEVKKLSWLERSSALVIFRKG